MYKLYGVVIYIYIIYIYQIKSIDGEGSETKQTQSKTTARCLAWRIRPAYMYFTDKYNSLPHRVNPPPTQGHVVSG